MILPYYESTSLRLQIAGFTEKVNGIQITGANRTLFVLKSDGSLASYKVGFGDAALVSSDFATKVTDNISKYEPSPFRVIKEIGTIKGDFYFRTNSGTAYVFKEFDGDIYIYNLIKDVARLTDNAYYRFANSFYKAVSDGSSMLPLLTNGSVNTIVSPMYTPFGDAFAYIKDNSSLYLRYHNGKEMDISNAGFVVDVLTDDKTFYNVKKDSNGYKLVSVNMGNTVTEGDAIDIEDWGYIRLVVPKIDGVYIQKKSADPNLDDLRDTDFPATQLAYVKSNGAIKPEYWFGFGKFSGTDIHSYALTYDPPVKTNGFSAIVPYYKSNGSFVFIGETLSLINLDGNALIDYLYKHECSKTLNVNSLSAMDFEPYNLGGFIFNYSGQRAAEIPIGDWETL